MESWVKTIIHSVVMAAAGALVTFLVSIDAARQTAKDALALAQQTHDEVHIIEAWRFDHMAVTAIQGTRLDELEREIRQLQK
jgi:hypothetical protein